jgi:hypothetical protein
MSGRCTDGCIAPRDDRVPHNGAALVNGRGPQRPEACGRRERLAHSRVAVFHAIPCLIALAPLGRERGETCLQLAQGLGIEPSLVQRGVGAKDSEMKHIGAQPRCV